MIQRLDGEWLLAVDAQNIGREEGWSAGPVPGAVPAKVPWIMQDSFPEYHGVAWYWREFTAPPNPHRDGRYLLRFWAVDYLAEVWVNGMSVGGHEGGETPFVVDVTEAVQTNASNVLAVRVLNPTNEPIDGIVLKETPHRNKAVPFYAGASYNHGGITDSVELILAPAVRIEDLFAQPDLRTDSVLVRIAVRNASGQRRNCRAEFSISPAATGETLCRLETDHVAEPGDSVAVATIPVEEPHRWDLNDPFLYRVTARLTTDDGAHSDEYSVRCGFRDFRFDDGCFRLNGRRIYLRSSHTGNHAPVGQQLPHDPDLFRRDLVYVKAMGFNCIRFIAGMATRYQLDLCDEIGLFVYEESYAGWLLSDSPKMPERFDRSLAEMVRRDRNHPCIVIWGLLNETEDGPVFRHAVESLRLVRSLDDSRMVLLNSGRWDGQLGIGSLSNPGSARWEHHLGDEQPDGKPTKSTWGGYFERVGDAHAYPRVPHTKETIRFLRTLGEKTKPVFLSEYGIGSAVDLWRVVRHYERIGKSGAEDARFYRERLDRFLADWEAYGLGEMFADPADYFRACTSKMAGQRTLGLDAIRSNPHIIGHSLTGTVDQGMTGEGLFTTFRELKPGAVDAVSDALAPLRLCLFAEPVNLYRGEPVRLEVVLANEDALSPGEYPVRVQVLGPGGTRVFERRILVAVTQAGPFAQPVFDETVSTDWSGGRYRFMAAFERGAAPTGGEAVFYVADPADMPPVETELVLWGEDAELATWLAQRGIRVGPHGGPAERRRQIMLASSQPPSPTAESFRDLAQQMACGSTVVFLSPRMFRKGDDPVGWLPLVRKGRFAETRGWLYLKDEWAKRHPIFEGLPSGGLMDTTYYRELIPDELYIPHDPPDEAVAGAIKTSQDYASGLMVSVHRFHEGRFILSTLPIRENLGKHPAAERLLRNMLRYASRGADAPAVGVPTGLDRLLDEMGY